MQPARWTVGTSALEQAMPRAGTGTPFGTLQLRAFPGSRAEALAFNLVMCGVGLGRELPCWFRDGIEVERVRLDGSGGVHRVAALAWQPPTVGMDVEGRSRPIRDVLISPSGEMYVLSTGGWDPGGSDDGLGRQLLRYDASNHLISRTDLAVPARLILTVHDHRCVVMAADGSLFAVPVS